MIYLITRQFLGQLGQLYIVSLLLLKSPSLVWCHRGARTSADVVVGRDGAVAGAGSFASNRGPAFFDPLHSILNKNRFEEFRSLISKRRKLQEEENPILGRNFTDVINDLFAGSDTNQTEEEELFDSNFTDILNGTSSNSNNETEYQLPTTGCSICKSSTLLADKIPNINWDAYQEGLADEVGNLTCLEWQEYALPTFVLPENCPSDDFVEALFILCCEASLPRYQCEQNIHNQIIANNENYNIAVPPVASYGEPLVVSTEVIFEYLENIDVEAGTASIFATFTLNWKDARLAWTMDDQLCADHINVFTGHDQEVTNIWVPEFDLLNQHQGVQGFRNKQATIYSDGSVKWIRTGPITAMCQYKGLAAIPFDTLGCQFIFGAGLADANLIAYKFIDEETVLTGQFDMIYSEYLPVKTKFEKGYTWYYNVDHASALFYNFYFTRAQAHYVANLVVCYELPHFIRL